MEYDTAGNEIIRMNPNCDCNSTCGCKKCNPMMFEPVSYPIGEGPLNPYNEDNYKTKENEMTPNGIAPIDEKAFYKKAFEVKNPI